MYAKSIQEGIPIRTTTLNVNIDNLVRQLQAHQLDHCIFYRKPDQCGIVLQKAPGNLEGFAWIVQHTDGTLGAYYYDEIDRAN